MFSIASVNFAESASTSMAWQLRVTAGSAQISMVVRSGPMPASDSAATTLTLAGKPAAASRAVPEKHQLRGVEAGDRDAVRDEIGRAFEAAGRLAGDHAHRMDAALRRGGNRVEASKAPVGTMIWPPCSLASAIRCGRGSRARR